MGQLLEIRDLCKEYREDAVGTKAVDHADLQVDEAEFVMIMGASGSGKTTLLHLIAGIDDFDSGSIRYIRAGGTADFSRMSEKQKTAFRCANIGIVFQQQCLIPDLTVYENIMLPMMLGKGRRGRAPMKDTILELCGSFGLKEHMGKYPSQLSGGQQQKAAILRAVVNRPPLLLCDEPTGSLNSAQSEMVMDLLQQLNQKGQTILLVTHDARVALRGGRVVYIADGRIAGELTLAEDGGPSRAESREDLLMAFLRERGW